MNTNCVFERIEKKYLISNKTFNLFIKKIEPYMTVDKYGLHTICNIYYDTEKFDLIRNSIEKPVYKEKLRLRSYGVPDKRNSMAFLELKKKFDNTVFKRRVSLTLEEAEIYMKHGIKTKSESQILKEIDYFVNLYNVEKKVFIAYDRIAMFGNENENLRITLDMGIRSRFYDLDLCKGDYGKLLDIDGYLMEIKTTNSLPIWLANILSELEIYPVSFSKYGNIYKQALIEGTILKNDWRNNKCLQVS